MAFKLAAKDRVKATITAKVPSDRGGYEKKTFTATIKKLYGDEKKAVLDNLEGRKDTDLIRDLVLDIGGLLDDDGKEIPFGDDLLAAIEPLDYITVPLARECLAVQDEGMRGLIAKN